MQTTDLFEPFARLMNLRGEQFLLAFQDGKTGGLMFNGENAQVADLLIEAMKRDPDFRLILFGAAAYTLGNAEDSEYATGEFLKAVEKAQELKFKHDEQTTGKNS